jgi:hypothetical protein
MRELEVITEDLSRMLQVVEVFPGGGGVVPAGVVVDLEAVLVISRRTEKETRR